MWERKQTLIFRKQSSQQAGASEVHITANNHKLSKVKDKEIIFKAARDNQKVTYKGNSLRLSDHLAEILQGRRELHNIFKVLKRKNKKKQPRIFFPEILSLRIEGERENVFQTNKS